MLGQRELKEDFCARDLVSTKKRNEAKKLLEILTKKLKNLLMLKTKFNTKTNLNNLIMPEIATLVSKLKASAVKSMELAQELIDSWAKSTSRLSNYQLSEYRDQFDNMKSEFERIWKRIDPAVIDTIVEAQEKVNDEEDE